jgi:putative transcriptional regulator
VRGRDTITRPRIRSPYSLNVTTGFVSQWERAVKRPRGPALKLLTLVAKKGLQAVA